MKKLTEEFSDTVIRKGRKFSIELVSCPSAGYGWELTVKGNASAAKESFTVAVRNKFKQLKQDVMVKFMPEKIRIGGSFKEIFTYRAEEAGVVEIEAQYKRPWEKNTPPAKAQTFTVTVK